MGRKLGRPTSHRLGLFSNLACSLFEHEQIETTLAKAKDLRRFAERMITVGKKGGVAARRQAASFLRSDEAVSKLFSVLAPRYKDRNGGYTRVIKAGFRPGDAADVAIIELVDRDADAKGMRQKKLAAERKLAEGAAKEAAKSDAKKTPAGNEEHSVKDIKGTKARAQSTGTKAQAHRKVIGP
jgi:large subunit ribosomal protein L17